VRLGNLVFTAGQAGIAEQTKRALENLKAVLEEAGANLDRVVKATGFLKDLNDFAAMNVVYAKYLQIDGEAPARTTVQVLRIPKDALVEIELIAEVSAWSGEGDERIAGKCSAQRCGVARDADAGEVSCAARKRNRTAVHRRPHGEPRDRKLPLRGMRGAVVPERGEV
jgi:2-iminobutanoate/2-iminopropanoate deaminase